VVAESLKPEFDDIIARFARPCNENVPLTLIGGYGIMPRIGIEGNEYAAELRSEFGLGESRTETTVRKILPELLTEKQSARPRKS